MPIKDELGNRMKTNYEQIPKLRLTRRTPVIIRIDGKAFHTFTKKFKKPFDHILMDTMQLTMKFLCENIQGCMLGYTQSDEISLLLTDYTTFETQPWFDYEVQKICSISASMATLAFNKFFMKNVDKEKMDKFGKTWDISISEEDRKYIDVINKACTKGAMFDSRCFNIPKEEVTNYFYWRQLDATRNSIQMVGQANFSQKQLHGKSCNAIQDMLHEEKGINWNDFSIPEKRGACCIKTESGWTIDDGIPIFKGDAREYIEKLI